MNLNSVIKKNIISSFIIGIIVVFSLSSTYAFLNFSASNSTNTNITAGCFQVNYSGQQINSSGLQSTTSYTGGVSTQIQLSKSKDCDIYTEANIYIYTDLTSTTAPTGANVALKYQVVQVSGTTEQVITNAKGSIAPDKDGKLLIHTVKLSSTTQTYKVYIWIDSNTSAGKYDGTTYKGYIYATATQTSTIK